MILAASLGLVTLTYSLGLAFILWQARSAYKASALWPDDPPCTNAFTLELNEPPAAISFQTRKPLPESLTCLLTMSAETEVDETSGLESPLIQPSEQELGKSALQDPQPISKPSDERSAS